MPDIFLTCIFMWSDGAIFSFKVLCRVILKDLGFSAVSKILAFFILRLFCEDKDLLDFELTVREPYSPRMEALVSDFKSELELECVSAKSTLKEFLGNGLFKSTLKVEERLLDFIFILN
jgi:hypothetical protein